MAIGVVLEFKGGTLDQYDQVIERMGLTPGGATPDGALFHWAAGTDDGIRVTDVWESRERFQEFADTQIGPHTQAVGLPGPPEITFYEVHSHLSA
ncbi:MAG TPA: hypothetical protein VFQ12_02935 [Thermoleophilaceae bacterium]|nr:hypothetical protein [Thermoleophilaceae bacterium]